MSGAVDFEVWNEPNIDFWTGDPKQATYFKLYDHTARALKRVSPRLRVGGPATSSAHWVDDFIVHVAAQNVPVDFISSHGYGDDTVEPWGGDSHGSTRVPRDSEGARSDCGFGSAGLATDVDRVERAIVR